MGISIPVLLYHHVNPSREITPDGFEKQMKFLSQKGYTSIFLDELVSFFKTGKIKNEKSVAITFDDGYLDNWLFTYPILQKYNLKATIFVVTSKIKDDNPRDIFDPDLDLHSERDPENFLSWEHIKIMGKSGLVSIEAHTHWHYKKGEDWPSETNMDYKEELALCKSIIEQKLGKKSLFIAWPWGEYTADSIRLAQEVGFQGAASTKVGSNRFGNCPMMIKRFKVRREDLDWFRSRLTIYSSALLGRVYGSFYGIERGIKKLWK